MSFTFISYIFTVFSIVIYWSSIYGEFYTAPPQLLHFPAFWIRENIPPKPCNCAGGEGKVGMLDDVSTGRTTICLLPPNNDPRRFPFPLNIIDIIFLSIKLTDKLTNKSIKTTYIIYTQTKKCSTPIINAQYVTAPIAKSSILTDIWYIAHFYTSRDGKGTIARN